MRHLDATGSLLAGSDTAAQMAPPPALARSAGARRQLPRPPSGSAASHPRAPARTPLISCCCRMRSKFLDVVQIHGRASQTPSRRGHLAILRPLPPMSRKRPVRPALSYGELAAQPTRRPCAERMARSTFQGAGLERSEQEVLGGDRHQHHRHPFRRRRPARGALRVRCPPPSAEARPQQGSRTPPPPPRGSDHRSPRVRSTGMPVRSHDQEQAGPPAPGT